MHIPDEAVRLRIYVGESDRWEHGPLYEAIVLKAREQHLAGATVLRGPLGFGKSSHLHTAKFCASPPTSRSSSKLWMRKKRSMRFSHNSNP